MSWTLEVVLNQQVYSSVSNFSFLNNDQKHTLIRGLNQLLLLYAELKEIVPSFDLRMENADAGCRITEKVH